jgi:hypothetical protein
MTKIGVGHMHRAAVTAAAGVLGIVIGAGGWALLGPEKTVHETAIGAPITVPQKTGPAHYTTAQAIADKLEASGFTVSMLHKSTSTDTTTLIDSAYDFTVTAKPGPAPGDSGINLFRNPQSLATWEGLSKSFGGIAVAGDTWAVSLASDTAAQVASSKTLAPQIAKALGGTVVE